MPTVSVIKAPKRRTLRRAVQSGKLTSLSQPVALKDDGRYRVLIEREVQDFEYAGHLSQRVKTTYLDGEEVTEVVSNGVKQASQANRPKALPVRTSNITDFGRLDAAALSLIQIMGEFDDDAPPSPEQMETLLSSYQNLVQWQIEVKRKLDAANASIDLVKDRLAQLLS